MNFHMARTTLVIDETILRRLKRLAAAEGRTLSDVTQEVLRRGLGTRPRAPRTPVELPVFDMGAPLVDIANRDALLDRMDEP